MRRSWKGSLLGASLIFLVASIISDISTDIMAQEATTEPDEATLLVRDARLLDPQGTERQNPRATADTSPVEPAREPTPVVCGQVIVESTKLANDVGPCPADGIIIGRDNIRLDLNGHRVFGTPRGPVEPPPDRGVGIRLPDRVGVEITSSQEGGTVTDFDAGISIEGGGRNAVYKVTTLNNVGSGCGDYGDGIVVSASSDNDIYNNVVVGNGPFSGISMLSAFVGFDPVTGVPIFQRAEDNIVKTNLIDLNNRENFCAGRARSEDDGVRIEPRSINNVVKQNTITRNGLDGVGVFINSPDNVVRENFIEDNGTQVGIPPHTRGGDGIHVFRGANRTDVFANDVYNNARDGIHIDERAFQNDIYNNKTGANDRFDLDDDNPNCDANVWQNNFFVTFNQPCTTEQGGGDNNNGDNGS